MKLKNYYRFISIIICISLCFSYSVAQGASSLPEVGAALSLTSEFNPATLKGISINIQNPLLFDFYVDKGEESFSSQQLQSESLKLIKYFLAALTVPEKSQWVNLSPNEKDRIATPEFGQTEMGRDLLEQDYILKQLTASLMNPDNALGEKFWDEVYKEAREKFNAADVPVETVNKVWIIPNEAEIFIKDNNAFIVKNSLKVMLEEDYYSITKDIKSDNAYTLENQNHTKEIIRQIIIPALEREVNTGKTFATLRKVYNSMLLATWYKRNLQQTLLGQVYCDKNKVLGIEIDDKNEKLKIYNQYMEALKKGVHNFIKEEYDPTTQQIIPRKYFAGGTVGYDHAQITETRDINKFLSNQDDNLLIKVNSQFLETRSDNFGVIKDFAMTSEDKMNVQLFTDDQVDYYLPLSEFRKKHQKEIITMIKQYNAGRDGKLLLDVIDELKATGLTTFQKRSVASFRTKLKKQLEAQLPIENKLQIEIERIDTDQFFTQVEEVLSEEELLTTPIEVKIIEKAAEKIKVVSAKVTERSEFELRSWGQKGVTSAIKESRRNIKRFIGQGDSVAIYTELIDLISNVELEEGIRVNILEDIESIKKIIKQEIEKASNDQHEILKSLTESGSRSFESWYLKDTPENFLVNGRGLNVGVFQRLVKQTLHKLALNPKYNLVGNFAPGSYVTGPAVYLMDGFQKEIGLSIYVTKLLEKSHSVDEFIGDFLSLFNIALSEINENIQIVSTDDLFKPKLVFTSLDNKKFEINLNISRISNPDSLLLSIEEEIVRKINSADLAEQSRGIMAAEYYLEQDDELYAELRDKYAKSTASEFMADSQVLERKVVFEKMISGSKDLLTSVMIEQRLRGSFHNFSPNIEPNYKKNQVNQNTLNLISEFIAVDEHNFDGKNILLAVLNSLINSNKIQFRTDLPQSFLTYKDKKTGEFYIFIDSSLRDIIGQFEGLNYDNLDSRKMSLLSFISARLINKVSEIVMEADDLVDWSFGPYDKTITNSAALAYLMELRFLSTIPGFVDGFALSLRGKPLLLKFYEEVLSSSSEFSKLIGIANGVPSNLRTFLESIGYDTSLFDSERIKEFDDFITQLSSINLNNILQNNSQLISDNGNRIEQGFGLKSTGLTSKEVSFSLELRDRLSKYKNLSEFSAKIANVLVLLKSDSLRLLRENNILSQRDIDALERLSLEDFNVNDFVDQLISQISNYKAAGFDDEFIDKNLSSHLLPIEEVMRLKRVYQIKEEDNVLLLSALSYSNVERWIKRVKQSSAARGTIDPTSIKRNEKSKQLKTKKERDDLKEQFVRLSFVLNQLRSLPKENTNFKYKIIDSNMKRHVISAETIPQEIKPGVIIRSQSTDQLFKVDKIVRNQITLVAPSASARLPELSKREGIMDIVEIDMTAEAAYQKVKDIIDSFDNILSISMENFSRYVGMRGLKDPNDPQNIKFYDKRIPFERVNTYETKGDLSHQLAVQLGLNSTELLLIEGPPGTGKTTVIRELIRQKAARGEKIIVTSKMHQAVDNAIEQFDDLPILRLASKDDKIKKEVAERFWPGSLIDEDVRKDVLDNFKKTSKEKFKGAEVYASTVISLVTTRYLNNHGVRADTLIIDEASTMTIPELIIAVSFLKPGGKLIVIGDIKQLSPTGIKFDQEERLLADGVTKDDISLYNKSAMKWLLDQDRGDRIMLSTNYRSHPIIAKLDSELFYDGKVRTRGWEDFNEDTLSIVDISKRGHSRQYYDKISRDSENGGKSFYNPNSLNLSSKIMRKHIKYLKRKSADVMYIATYAAQVADMKRRLEVDYKDPNLRPIASTVDGIQGGESSAVVMDMVRSNKWGNVGFTLEEERLNVGISRAKDSLTLLLDLRTYGNREIIKNVMKFYRDEVLSFLPESVDSAMIVSQLIEDQEKAISIDPVGGINLDPEFLKLQIKRDGAGIPLPISQQPIGDFNIDGFFPIILDITPVTNFPLILGTSKEFEPELELSSR